jgi:GAF domain-containing protein
LLLAKAGLFLPITNNQQLITPHGKFKTAVPLEAPVAFDENENRECDDFKAGLRRVTSEAGNENEFFEKIGKVFIGQPDVVFIWVGLVQESDKTVVPVYEAGPCGSYLDGNKFTYDDSLHGGGPTGLAVKTGRPAVMNDIAVNPVYEPWREKALRHGFASSAAVPLLKNGRVIGTLNMYCSRPKVFTEKRLACLSEAADVLSEVLSTFRNIK